MIRGKTSGRTRAAMIQLLGARAVSIAATAIGFAILARLLSPSTFGYFAIIVASYGVLNVLVEFGLRQFLIRAEYEIDVGAIRSATRLSLVIAVCACGLCIAADALPTTLLVEDVQDAMKPMGLALLVSPLVLGREAQLQRSLRFKALAGSAVARTVTDVLVAISMAAAGFGVMALASAFLAGRIVEAALIFAFGRPDTGNTATGARPPLRRYLAFGRRMTIVSLLPKLAELALLSILGAVSGAAVVGLYNRAMTIRQLLDKTLLQGIGPAILPTISDALRQGTEPVRILAIKVDYLVALIWPAFGLIALLADPLVHVMLGPQWNEAVPAVRILAVAGIALPFTKMVLKFFTAIDRVAIYLRIQMIHLAVRLSLGSAAAFISLEAFCAALVLSICVKACLVLHWCHSHYGTGMRPHHGAVGRGLVMTAITLLPPGLVMGLGADGIAAILAGLPMACAGWLAGIALTGHRLSDDLRLQRLWPRVAGRQR